MDNKSVGVYINRVFWGFVPYCGMVYRVAVHGKSKRRIECRYDGGMIYRVAVYEPPKPIGHIECRYDGGIYIAEVTDEQFNAAFNGKIKA
jgi:hypothetical protein